jgi:hypothetical protein
MLRLLAQRGPGFLEPRDPQQEEAGPSTQKATPGTSRDFSKIPLFAPGTVEPFQVPSYFSAPRLPIQAKLKVGAVNDPLEYEADRLAGQVMRMPQPAVSISSAQPKLRAAATGDPLERGRAAPSPDSFRGRGDPLPVPVRGFFEQRLDYDFGGVRVHHGPDASESALSLGARAYTYGRDIVFGAGEYSPGSGQAKQLLAHELAHVVQQGAGHALVQRSPLSDSVKDAWTAEPKIEALLARLSQSDVQTAQADTDVDAEIARILVDRADDLAVALQIRKGQLGQTTGAFGPKDTAGNPKPRPIEATFFRGSTDRRALVIAGVHGTERQGIEVARRLIGDLKSQTPFFTTIIVPSLFPDNEASRQRESGKSPTDPKLTPTNRNFPSPSEDLAAAKKAGGGTAVDELKRPILPENLLLLELMERFHPERIISIHGTSGPGSAGVFYDRRSLRPDEVQAARDWASEHTHIGRSPQQEDEAGGEARLLAVQKALFQQRLAQMSGQAADTDRNLSLNAATQIDTATSSTKKGREGRDMSREKESKETTKANEANRRMHPSIAGNVGSKGLIDNATWSGGVPGGVSLGGYAPPRGMSVFTVEPPLNFNSADVKDKTEQANRIKELQSYAGAVRTVLLGA